MKRTKRNILLAGGFALLAMASYAPKSAHADFFFHDGDKPAVFLGDSITEPNVYTSLIQSYVLTRYPKWDITFRNIGWSGDTAGLRQRGGQEAGLRRDILPLKPMAITIDFGMNDARAGDKGYQAYIDAQIKLVEALKAMGARVALLTPSPEERYEPNQPAGSAYNAMLWKYSQGLKQVADKEQVPFVDQYTPFVKVIEDGRKAGVLSADASGLRLTGDAVHPNWPGHLVMAASILKGLGATAPVSSVDIDAAGRRISVQGAQAQLQDNPNDKNSLVFTRKDDVLPWSLPPETASVLKVPGFDPLNDLSRYMLKVTGLTAAKYDLFIDDKKTATFTKEELATGVNLTQQAGPITEQSLTVLRAAREKDTLFSMRWRNVQLFNVPWLKDVNIEPQRQAEMARIETLITEKEEQLKQLRQPVQHTFKLTPSA